MSDNRYRPELDGIRAVAVLFVIINHFNEALLPSGFLGVDVFFVLSGYVVAASLSYRQSTSWHEFLLSFIARRIKRIVPALVACVFIAGFAGCFVTKDRTSLFAGAYALFGASNLFFLELSIAYFGTEARHNLFTHTWSLGVEEQFYLLFPWIIILTGSVRTFSTDSSNKNKRRLLVLLVALCAASIICWIYLSSNSSLRAYFLMPARFWELGLGSLTFYLSETLPSKSFTRTTSTLTVGTALISLVCIAFLPYDLRGYSTIAICLATAATIRLLSENTLPHKIMSTPLLVGVGVLSYSLYLWHWPVLTLARYTVGVSAYTVIPIIILIILLAFISYRLIEKPFRYGTRIKSSKLVILFGVIAVIVCIGWIEALLGPLKGKFLPEEMFDRKKPAFSIYPAFEHCSSVAGFDSQIVPPPCYYSSYDSIARRPTIWMIGDSTTWALKSMASELVVNEGLNIVMFADDSAFPSTKLIRFGSTDAETARWDKDHEFHVKTFKYVLDWAKRGDIVFVTADLSNEFCNTPELYCRNNDGTSIQWKTEEGELLTTNDAFQRFLREMEALSSNLKKRNVAMIISAPLPRWEREHLFYCERQWFRPEWLTNKCQFPGLTEQESSRKRILTALQAVESRSDLLVYDPFPFFCNSASCNYSDPQNNDNYWIDETHLSTSGGKRLYPHFLSYLTDHALLEQY